MLNDAWLGFRTLAERATDGDGRPVLRAMQESRVIAPDVWLNFFFTAVQTHHREMHTMLRAPTWHYDTPFIG